MNTQSGQAHWLMLTLVGKDRPGIVAQVSAALYKAGCNFGEASMMRLGGNFSMMLMVQHAGAVAALEQTISPLAKAMNLICHMDIIDGQLHDHRIPDVRISVYGADRAGIVAQVTNVLADAGLDIFDLESDVAGTDQQPVYIMHIEGHAGKGIEELQHALSQIDSDIKVSLQPIQIMVS